MKISLGWLKELVDYQLSSDELANQLSLTSIGVKQQTEDYLELDLTYNRGDLLSLRGVAYEVSAITNTPLKFLSDIPEDYTWAGKNLPQVKVEIEDEKLCPVYCVAKIENLKVEHSDDTWIKKLSDSGMRSINNIADATNLIMLEYGQPMHAFSAKAIKNETIKVRVSKKGEMLKTLDNKVRKLEDDLLITDSESILGMAGVMGGKDSEISEDTTTILLEAAIFEPLSIRKTSKRHGLYSEASKRFQHGLTKIRLLQALDGAIKLYQTLGGTLTAITLKGDFGQVNKSINLSIQKTNSLFGVLLDEETITKALQKLNFDVNPKDADTLEITSPYFRKDIEIEEDVIEEVARIYGYEKIEARPLEGEKPEKLDQSLQNFIHDLKVSCKEAGLTEVQSYSFYSSETINDLRLTINDLVKIANPISSETEYMRTFIWPNLIEVVAKNIRAGFKQSFSSSKDIAVFEIGKIYQPASPDASLGGPTESYRLAIALMNGSDHPIDELLVIARNVMTKQSANMGEIATSPSAPRNDDLFHPTRFTDIKVDAKVVGTIAEVHPRFLNNFGIDKRVAILEINIEI